MRSCEHWASDITLHPRIPRWVDCLRVLASAGTYTQNIHTPCQRRRCQFFTSKFWIVAYNSSREPTACCTRRTAEWPWRCESDGVGIVCKMLPVNCYVFWNKASASVKSRTFRPYTLITTGVPPLVRLPRGGPGHRPHRGMSGSNSV